MGTLRQGLQYSYIVRNLWSGAGGTTNPSGNAEGTDNMVHLVPLLPAVDRKPAGMAVRQEAACTSGCLFFFEPEIPLL